MPTTESVIVQNSTLSWRSIFAGLAVTLLCYFILMSLGLAIGGAALKGVIQGSGDGQGLGIGSGIWLVLSALISLFVGSYASGQVSGLASVKVGRTQGAVICALFFALVFSQIGSTIGLLGKGLGSTVSSLGQAAGSASQNPQVQETIRASLGDLNLRSSPDTVAQGLATRILRGDTTGARDYLARQAGISPAEADRRLQSLKNNAQSTLKDVGGGAAGALSIAGWTLFGALLLGAIASILGGGAGSKANLDEPFLADDIRDRPKANIRTGSDRAA